MDLQKPKRECSCHQTLNGSYSTIRNRGRTKFFISLQLFLIALVLLLNQDYVSASSEGKTNPPISSANNNSITNQKTYEDELAPQNDDESVGNEQKVVVFFNNDRCNPKEFRAKPHPDKESAFIHCNSDGKLTTRNCPKNQVFNATTSECGSPKKKIEIKTMPMNDEIEKSMDPSGVLQYPQFQAPDDICSGGIPLTRLSAPVVCNPSVSSCPDGYYCTLHSRTGTSYCCQDIIEPAVESTLCVGNQVTYFDQTSGLPKSCVLSSSSSCPVGFGCNLVGGSFTRCCGRDFGCPTNSAGFLNPNTGAHVQCNTADPASCPQGFVCTQSSMFNTGICCSDTSSTPSDVCGGDNPLSRPNPCSASSPCPAGFSCRNGRCCPSKGLCPAGSPLGGMTSCSPSNPCPNNYQCVTSNGQQYCCPAPEHVCGQPRDAGLPCETRVSAVSRYYFDTTTGSCRAFQYSQCGGNANNFDTLEQCESFCLDSQCPHGTGLRAGPGLATCSAAHASSKSKIPVYAPPVSSMDSTCPSHYSCVQPIFGNNFVCCTSSEHVCRDTVTSGTACFGAFLTVQRYHYNTERGQCEPFQYYGCNGSGNNFLTKRQCESACQPLVRSACNGVAPLNDEGDYVQRCSEKVPCPRGSWCNSLGYCCPHTETACQSPKSIGHTCLSQKPGTYWYFDTSAEACMPFIYSGCGGTPNRFASREACEQMCINKLGECPRGMTPFLTSGGTKQCSLNVAGSCPEGSSCVRSSMNEPICCSSTAQCPIGRSAYLIPGSDSRVACLPDDDNCPQGYQCLQSSNVAGFYMCCSSGNMLRRRLPTIATATSRRLATRPQALPEDEVATLIAAVAASNNRVPSTNELVPQRYAAAAPRCPSGLHSNGQRCTVNEIEGCPHGYLCLSGTGGQNAHGVCCKTAPKCQHKRRKPYFVGKKQVLTCGDDEAGCPRGSSCTPSSIDGVDICCLLRSGPVTASGGTFSSKKKQSAEADPDVQQYSTFSKVPKVVPKCRDGSLPFFALGSRVPQSCKEARDDECPEEYECNQASDNQYYCCPAWDRCPNNASPFLVEGSRKPLGCNWMANNCPEGYSCEGSKDRAICCKSRPTAAQCPVGRSAFLYAKRPLICPPGKKSCPSGYDCIPSRTGNVHLCCSSEESNTAECVSGYAYFDPATNRNQLCDPLLNSCPHGYECKRSTLANAHVCCTDNRIDNRYDGYCPPGQIPYTGMSGSEASPPTCHMTLSPCPTTAPYQCVYSPEKQNSYCCAPVDMTSSYRNTYRNFASQKRGNKKNSALEQQRQLQQQQLQQLQQYQQQQQQYQFQQQRNAELNTEYAAAMAAAVAKNGLNNARPGCATNMENGLPAAPESTGDTDTISSSYPIQSSQYLTQQQQYLTNMAAANSGCGTTMTEATGTNDGAVGIGPQYPPTTVVDPSAANSIFVASCPPWSKPLLNPQTQLGHACSTWNRCPTGFTCYSNFPDGRNAHCCTTVPLDNQIVFRANTPEATAAASNWVQSQHQTQFSPEMTVAHSQSNERIGELNGTSGELATAKPTQHTAFLIQCPAGSLNVGGVCKRMYFVGQQGCETDAQCNQRTNNTRCYKNYCVCNDDQLIHEMKCVPRCPDGFLSIAGRCHDLTTVVFMDSVDERQNGTIGGFCQDTVIKEEQCLVNNSYCNERSITCQCRPGFELQMDFGNKNDSGSCRQVEGTKYNGTESQESNRRFQDNVLMDENENYSKSIDTIMNDEEIKPVQLPQAFFEIGYDDANLNATNKTKDSEEANVVVESTISGVELSTISLVDTTTTANSENKSEIMEATTTPSSVQHKPLNDTQADDSSFFFQSDDK